MYIVLLQLDSSYKYIYMRYVVDFNNRSNFCTLNNLFFLLGHYYKSASIKSRINKNERCPSKNNNNMINTRVQWSRST